MKPARINNSNACPGAPKDWDEKKDGSCGALPIQWDGRYAISAWKPTSKELAELNAGGYVTLTVVGWQPPVMIGTLDSDGAREIE